MTVSPSLGQCCPVPVAVTVQALLSGSGSPPPWLSVVGPCISDSAVGLACQLPGQQPAGLLLGRPTLQIGHNIVTQLPALSLLRPLMAALNFYNFGDVLVIFFIVCEHCPVWVEDTRGRISVLWHPLRLALWPSLWPILVASVVIGSSVLYTARSSHQLPCSDFMYSH